MTSYGDAGVDLEGATRHVDAISNAVTATWSDNVVGDFGGFAAGVEIPAGYKNPILMMTTDGVGTKLDLARRSGNWSGVGHDLVAMCVDDLAATGAASLGFVDYMAVGSLDSDRDTAIVESIADACSLAGCALLGGETAEHPGVMDSDAVDLAGAVMGVVEKGEQLGPHRVQSGDIVLGLSSSNVRSNGFSLIRSVFADELDVHIETFLQPSVIYAPVVLEAVASGGINSAAHITGGGLAENLARALPDGFGVSIARDSWTPPDVFNLIASRGVEPDDMYRTFNMGIGFCLIIDPNKIDNIGSIVADHAPTLLGEIESGSGVEMA